MDSSTGIPADLSSAARARAGRAVTMGAQSSDLFVPADRSDALPRNEFLQCLNSEKRRSERTKLPLSVVLFRPLSKEQSGGWDTHRLLETLHRTKRETDILGHVGDGAIAVLCTDTDEQGTGGFVRKISAAMGDLRHETAVATYPDVLFEHLVDNARTPAALEPFIVRSASGKARCTYPGKRLVDVVGASVALLLLSPVMLVVALIIASGSRGPVIFRQMRCGAAGVPFTFYKFRSMRIDGDDGIHRAYVADLIRNGAADKSAVGTKSPVYKLQSDPRVTPIGRFMRKSSIDELPQLFNVLKGDMSLVGPRPPIPYETAHYQSWHLRRILSAKPGMTGLWQVQGRSKVKFNEMVRMDIRYCEECSFLLDLKILLKTVVVVFRTSGSS